VAGVRQYLVEIGRDDEDRVCGTVAREGLAPTPFAGWLELLGLLEGDAGTSIPPDEGADIE
jgi:hypothetical protein